MVRNLSSNRVLTRSCMIRTPYGPKSRARNVTVMTAGSGRLDQQKGCNCHVSSACVPRNCPSARHFLCLDQGRWKSRRATDSRVESSAVHDTTISTLRPIALHHITDIWNTLVVCCGFSPGRPKHSFTYYFARYIRFFVSVACFVNSFPVCKTSERHRTSFC